MKYSQNDEESVITNYFKTGQGSFLDIGAYDGKTFSNTLKLVEMGWTGVCIEPSPSVFCSLLKLHGDNDKIKLINSAVTESAQLIEFFDSGGDALSTSNPKHKAKWEKLVKFQPYYIKSITIDEILAKFGSNFNFINLDVEGCSAKLFESIPLHRLSSLRLICIEHDGQAQRILGLAQKFGFKQLHLNGENIILGK